MTMLSNSLAAAAETLKVIVATAEKNHIAAVTGMIEAGRLLNEAKEECAHGEWASFLERASVHERKARRYMQLARSGLNRVRNGRSQGGASVYCRAG